MKLALMLCLFAVLIVSMQSQPCLQSSDCPYFPDCFMQSVCISHECECSSSVVTPGCGDDAVCPHCVNPNEFAKCDLRSNACGCVEYVTPTPMTTTTMSAPRPPPCRHDDFCPQCVKPNDIAQCTASNGLYMYDYPCICV